MENKQEEGKQDEKGCCAKGGKCCKVFAALGLLLIGGLGGFFAGKNCGKVCPLSPSAPSAVIAPK